MSAPRPATDRVSSANLFGIDPDLVADCIHCGLCLETCPTFVETGKEEESPRGRLLLMSGLASGRWGALPEVLSHLDLCLGCRACETACPSGVQYGRILEGARAVIEPGRDRPQNRLERFLVRHVLWRGALLARLAVFYRLGRLWGPAWALARAQFLPRAWRDRFALAPRMESSSQPHGRTIHRGHGPPVILLRGCVARAVFPQTEAAMMDLLGAAGYTVSLADQPECCGALAHHIGESDRARRFARELFATLPEDTPIVTTAAGCGAHLKGLSHLFTAEADRDKAGETAGRTRDLTEALGEGPRPLAFRKGRQEKVIYQDACHLRHGQDVTEQPRRLLRAAGAILEEVEEADLCCGSAGTYNIAQAEMAARLGRRKARLLSTKGPRTVVTHNPGCLIQLQTHLAGEMKVVSLARFLADRLAV